MEPHDLLVIKVSKGAQQQNLSSARYIALYFISIRFNVRPLTPSLILRHPSNLSHGFRTVTTLHATFPTCQNLLELIALSETLCKRFRILTIKGSNLVTDKSVMQGRRY
jgi:hypothetical protein